MTKTIKLYKQEQASQTKTVASLISSIQSTLLNAYDLSGNDIDVLTDLINYDVYQLTALLGINGDEESTASIKEQLEELHAYNDSMFNGNPHYIPRFTSGEPIGAKDVADVNINTLYNIAETLGIEIDD